MAFVLIIMASSPSDSNSAIGMGFSRRRPLGFIANVKKNKQSFFQFFVMTGVLLLSVRSLGQKYRLENLQNDTAALRDEKDKLTDRMNNIKSSLLHEASLDASGVFASRLSKIFADDE